MIDLSQVINIMLDNTPVEQITDSHGNVLWGSSPVVVPDYFYVEDISGSTNTLSIKKDGSSASSISVYKSTDCTNWTSMGNTDTTAITATIPANGRLYLKATANNWSFNVITASGNHNVGGNIMSLFYGDNYVGQNTFPLNSSSIVTIFKNNTTLINAKDLILPVTDLSGTSYVYSSVFLNCSNLLTAPALPATTLAQYCYNNMFQGCTALTTAPELPATTLASYCYQNMFYGCTSLNTVTTYANNISANSCTFNWLSGVSATGDFYNLGTATYTIDSPSGIPTGWTEVYAEYFYIEDTSGSNNTLSIVKSMPSAPTIEVFSSTDKTNWTSMGTTSTTAITATITANGKLYLKATANAWANSMSYYNSIKCTGNHNVGGNILSVIYGDNFTNYTNVSSSYTFDSLFTNNSHLVSASNLKLPKNASSYMYDSMFYSCTALTAAPKLPNPSYINSYAFRHMFYGCSHLTKAPTLPTRLSEGCFEGMFRGCTSLTTAPELPALTLVEGCYKEMFYGCSSLNKIVVFANSNSATDCTTNWLYYVAATGTFDNRGSAVYATDSASGIPQGWTEPAPLLNYFYVEDTSGSDNTLSITKNNADAPTIEVFKSTDMVNWTSMGTTDTTAITATIPANGKLYLKATTNKWGDLNLNQYNNITASGSHNVGGNIMSLLYGDNHVGQTSFPSGSTYNFKYLFRNNINLVNANELELPATTLADGCYQNMFSGCRALTTAPTTLPATTLATNCYQNMFSGCTSLTTAPALPATTLYGSCYYGMFKGCTSLTTAPTLPATTLATFCYQYMFYGCSSLTTAPELPATTLYNNCYQNMFMKCSALTQAPALPATTMYTNCYREMFNGCTSLTTAPELPATTLATGCYQQMFNGCRNLNKVTIYATNISTSNLTNWLNNVAATGDFYNLGGATFQSGTSGIPTGWTEHTSL